MFCPSITCVKSSIIFIICLLCFAANGQFVKDWEINTTTTHAYQPSSGPTSSNLLKTFKNAQNEYVVLGDTKEIYVFSYNAEGEIVWEYKYSSPFELFDYGLDMAMDSEGNFIIGAKRDNLYQEGPGYVDIFSDFLVIKISSVGELLWEQELTGGEVEFNSCNSIALDVDDNIYATGEVRVDNARTSVLVKYNAQGEVLWTKYLDNGIGVKVEVVNNEVYCFTNLYNNDVEFYKFDFLGNEILNRTLGSMIYTFPKVDSKGNIYQFPFTGEFKIHKRNSSGDLLWTYEKETNLPPNVFADKIVDCTVDEEDNVYFTGRYKGEHYGNDLLYTNTNILSGKLNAQGQLIWEDLYDNEGTPLTGEGPQQIQLDASGHAVVLGTKSVEMNGDLFASSDMVLLRYDDAGNRINFHEHDSDESKEEESVRLIIEGSDYYFLGWSKDEQGVYDQHIAKYSFGANATNEPIQTQQVSLQPNPVRGNTFQIVTDLTSYNLNLFDVAGHLLYQQENNTLDANITLQDQPAPGIYFIQIIAGDEVWTEKVVFSQN